QKAVAAAQNSKLGTGGSKHRHSSAGEWVDHGHHALMRIAAFRAVGGYDETFSHNEDAELDYRLRQAGYRIWMSGGTQMVYYPRSTLKSLYFQYLGYGRGRAKNVLKHRVVPKVRQMIPLLVAPVVLLALYSFIHWLAAVPFLLWAAVCLGYGAVTAIRQRNLALALAGVSAMVMHFGWSVGFWQQLLMPRSRREAA
ncbi:MAG: glycosyltransferase family 2 protein, partial [Pseudomonadota bacterium]